jgi:hypothetical protein
MVKPARIVTLTGSSTLTSMDLTLIGIQAVKLLASPAQQDRGHGRHSRHRLGGLQAGVSCTADNTCQLCKKVGVLCKVCPRYPLRRRFKPRYGQ